MPPSCRCFILRLQLTAAVNTDTRDGDRVGRKSLPCLYDQERLPEPSLSSNPTHRLCFLSPSPRTPDTAKRAKTNTSQSEPTEPMRANRQCDAVSHDQRANDGCGAEENSCPASGTSSEHIWMRLPEEPPRADWVGSISGAEEERSALMEILLCSLLYMIRDALFNPLQNQCSAMCLVRHCAVLTCIKAVCSVKEHSQTTWIMVSSTDALSAVWTDYNNFLSIYAFQMKCLMTWRRFGNHYMQL